MWSKRHEVNLRLLALSCIDIFIFWWPEAWNCEIKVLIKSLFFLIKSFFALCQVLNSRHWHHQSHSTNHPLKGGKLSKRIHLFTNSDHHIIQFSQRRISKSVSFDLFILNSQKGRENFAQVEIERSWVKLDGPWDTLK